MTPLPIEDQEIQDALDKAIEAKNNPPKPNDVELARQAIRIALELANIHYAQGAIGKYNGIKLRFELKSGKRRKSLVELAIRSVLVDVCNFIGEERDTDTLVKEFMDDYTAPKRRGARNSAEIKLGERIETFTSPSSGMEIKRKEYNALVFLKGVTIHIIFIRGHKNPFKQDEYLKHVQAVK